MPLSVGRAPRSLQGQRNFADEPHAHLTAELLGDLGIGCRVLDSPGRRSCYGDQSTRSYCIRSLEDSTKKSEPSGLGLTVTQNSAWCGDLKTSMYSMCPQTTAKPSCAKFFLISSLDTNLLGRSIVSPRTTDRPGALPGNAVVPLNLEKSKSVGNGLPKN